MMSFFLQFEVVFPSPLFIGREDDDPKVEHEEGQNHGKECKVKLFVFVEESSDDDGDEKDADDRTHFKDQPRQVDQVISRTSRESAEEQDASEKNATTTKKVQGNFLGLEVTVLRKDFEGRGDLFPRSRIGLDDNAVLNRLFSLRNGNPGIVAEKAVGAYGEAGVRHEVQ